jgi:hypothetical protein
MKTTSVSKSLDKKLTIFGFEVYDLLAIFIVLSTLNLLFGQSSLKLFFVWLPTIAIAALLRFGKRGRPDRFLVHWLRFQIKSGHLSAFEEPSDYVSPPHLFKESA